MPKINVPYLYPNLQGGKIVSGLTVPLTASFTSSGTSYFIIEQVGGKDHRGFYTSSVDTVIGSISDFPSSSINLVPTLTSSAVMGPYKFSLIIPDGTSSMVYVPNTFDSNIDVKLQIAGRADLNVSINI